jgi:signal peptidase II
LVEEFCCDCSAGLYLEERLKKLLHNYGFLFGIAGLIVLLDQITKEIVRQNLAFEEIWSPWAWLAPYARIVNWHNFGAAFGIFQNGALIFTILAIVVSILIIIYFPRIPRQEHLLRFALALQLGGALGNLIDRLTQGYVTDFVSVGKFPVFNVADACISMGAVLLVISVWLSDHNQAAATSEVVEGENESSPPQTAKISPQPAHEAFSLRSPEEHVDE